MNLKVLSSNSSGNCYLLQTETDTLILDCGVRYKDIQVAFNFDSSGVAGCIVTHRHSDHLRAANDIMKAGIEVYAPIDCAELVDESRKHRFHPVDVGKQFTIGDFIVLPVEAQHDVPCVSFLIAYRPTGEKMLYSTDTFYLKNRFRNLNYMLIESNYCKDTIDENIANGSIPREMKNRLLESHFSLEHVKEFLSANDLSKVKKIVLLHLSSVNSDAERMVREITELTGKDTEIAEAGKNIPLELYPF